MSLMGSVFPHSTTEQPEFLFDSDITAALFTRYLDGLVHLRPVSYPIALPKNAKAELINLTWLGDNNYARMLPTHAIVGMGLLDLRASLLQGGAARRKTAPRP